MKNILITGANRGLGLGLVKKFLKYNEKVFCTTRNIKKSKELILLKTLITILILILKMHRSQLQLSFLQELKGYCFQQELTYFTSIQPMKVK